MLLFASFVSEFFLIYFYEMLGSLLVSLHSSIFYRKVGHLGVYLVQKSHFLFLNAWYKNIL